MGQHQREIDDTLMSKAPAWVRHKVRQGLPPTKKELSQMNSFLTGARQVANTSAPFDKDEERHEDPKIQMAIQRLKANLDANPQGRAVVYSNFLGAGVNPYRQHLDEMKIPYGVFTGDQTPTIREQYVRDYNEGKLKALLLSSAGGEGLDLKNTSLVQLLEPHWNAERGKQVQGRAIRYKSHESLPKDKRKVLVERYVSTRPKSGVLERAGLRNPGLSVDEYLTDMSQRKEQLNQKFRDLLKDRRTKAEKEPSR
jgi:SNF2 family DNA or RNA helicase